jgi:two-component system alkaline phosphatase synthesis response regulator PhoP
MSKISGRRISSMADKKVLVVDDEIHIVHVVGIKFRHHGYEVLSADNGTQAYNLACQEQPDIIITDYQMPNMTGLELLKKLRQTETTKTIPVILLTARIYGLSKEECDKLGIWHCVSKPFSPKELLHTVEDILFSVHTRTNC